MIAFLYGAIYSYLCIGYMRAQNLERWRPFPCHACQTKRLHQTMVA